MKIAFVVGHSQKSQGAVDVNGLQEWSFHLPVAEKCVAIAVARGHEAAMFLRPNGGYTTAMAALVKEINAYQPDLVVSLHFNATPTHTVSGTEALHWPGSEGGEPLAKALAEEVSKALGTRNRGAKAQTHSHSSKPLPLYILKDTDAWASIVETHFGDVASDVAKAMAGRQSGALARAIVAGCERGAL